jgi:hypothetical protein
MKLLIIFSLILTTSFFTLSAEATSYYVSPSGSGASCSQLIPCSLDSGLSKANAGDNIVLMDGVYRQYVKTRRSGENGKPITLRALNKHKAILEPPSSSSSSSVGIEINHSNITVKGIVLDGKKQ